MITIISKFLFIPLYPVGLAIVFGILALILILINKRKSGLTALGLSVITLLIFSSPIVSHYLMRSLESWYNPSYSYPPASAIVLLGGAEVAKLPPRIHYETNANGDRITYAARLLKQNAAPFLITTGGKISFIKEFPGSEAQISFSLLTDLYNIDSSKIFMDTLAKTTHENALNVKATLDARGLKSTILLVTSAFHMPRSVAVFKKAGITVYPAPADYSEDRDYKIKLYNCFPNAGALAQSTTVIHEIYGIIGYTLMGWI